MFNSANFNCTILFQTSSRIMVIKIAFEKSPPFRHYPKQFPWFETITKPGRGIPKKVNSKWTNMARVFNRRVYTQWFGNSRFIMLVNIEKLDKFKLALYNQKLRPLGCEMVRVKHADAVPVFNNMGLNGLANALRSSGAIPTMIVYAYGNELSPLGNVETIPIIKKVIQEFHQNKRKPNNYVVAGAIDREVMSARQLVSLLEYKKPEEYWGQLNGLLNAPAQIPSMLQLSQMSLVNALQYYVENEGESESSKAQTESESVAS